MISNVRYITITVIMLVLLGFGFNNQSRAQVGLDGLLCPGVPDTTGWLSTEITGFGSGFNTNEPDFIGSLLGTVENSGPDAVAGLDWQQVDDLNRPGGKPTNEIGSQLVTWWTQKDGRNTYLQVTNSNDGECRHCDDGNVNVHVRIYNEDCIEVRNFCDVYTPKDTHEYNFGDLFANTGAPIADGNLQGVEGWLVVTPVKDCALDTEQPIDHDYMSGQLIVHDSDDYLYGVNTYARQGVCFNIEDTPVPTNKIINGSFQNGPDEMVPSNWTKLQDGGGGTEGARAIMENGISPPVTPIAATPPDPANGFQAILASSNEGGYGPTQPGGYCHTIGGVDIGGSCAQFSTLADSFPASGQWFSLGDVTKTTILSQNFTVTNEDVANTPGGVFITYNIQYLAPENAENSGANCQSPAAVCLVDTIAQDLVHCDCVNADGAGEVVNPNGANFPCTEREPTTDDYVSGPYVFGDGLASVFNGSEGISAGNYAVQLLTAQQATDGCTGGDPANDTGAIFNNVRVIYNEIEDLECDGCLDGSFNAKLVEVTPKDLYGQFNILPGNVEAGADVVYINFKDDYGDFGEGPYEPVPAFSKMFLNIFDENEIDQSCGNTEVCFARFGIDDALIPSEQFSPATPTPTPTVPPTATPTPTAPPTATPTPTPTNSGGSGSCAIAGSPVQLGTALANVLIPLVPVAFAFGVRAARRRKK